MGFLGSGPLLLLKLACLVALLVQTAANFYHYFIQPDRQVNIADVSLQSLEEFPLVLQVVLHEGFSESNLEAEGYNSTDDYFLGQSRFNDSVFGWRGHTMNGSTKGRADEVFKRVKHPRNIKQFLRKIQQIKMDRNEVSHVIENLEINSSRPYFPENAINIHLEQLGGMQETGIFSLGFENLTKHGIEKMELRLLDRGLVTSRPLVTLGQYQSDLIVICNKSESNALIENHYNIVMEQNQFLEEDNKCITYPTEEFKDYRTCDESFQRKHLQKHTPFKPYWAFGNLCIDEPNIITDGSIDAVTHNTVNLLYTGATRSSCLPPCTTTIAKTKFRFEKVSDTEGKDSERLNWIVFYLPEEMRVTSTTMKVTTFSQILSDLGGTLGLWLGLGVLQLFQSVVIIKQNEAVNAFKKLMLRNDKPSF